MEKIGVIGYNLLNLRRHIYRKVHVWLGLSLIVTVTKIQLKCVKAWEIDAKKYQSAFMHKYKYNISTKCKYANSRNAKISPSPRHPTESRCLVCTGGSALLTATQTIDSHTPNLPWLCIFSFFFCSSITFLSTPIISALEIEQESRYDQQKL